MDRIEMEESTYESRGIRDELFKLGYKVGSKRVRRLMGTMSIEPIYLKPRLSLASKAHKKYPYLLRNLDIVGSNQVWSHTSGGRRPSRLSDGVDGLVESLRDPLKALAMEWTMLSVSSACKRPYRPKETRRPPKPDVRR